MPAEVNTSTTAKGEEVLASSGSETWTHYIWQGSQVIAEHDATTGYTTNPTYQANSARVDYIYSGSRMISSRERASSGGSWTTKYYLSDRLSTRLVLDNSGNVLGRQAHLPFGEDFGGSGSQEKHHFTSYERDGESGLDYAINRYDSPSIGRFIRVDPKASSARLDAPQSWNRYIYTNDEPLNQVDPLGLDPLTNPEYCPPSVRDCASYLGASGFSAGIISGGGGGEGWSAPIPTVPSPKKRLYAGFSSGELEKISAAMDEAIALLEGTTGDIDIDNSCQSNLGARALGGRTINVASLINTIRGWRVKPNTADESVWGPFDIINGAKSEFQDIVDFRGLHPGAGGAIWGQSLVLFSGFFGGGPGHRIGFPQSRGVALIHEAIHLQGISDLDFGSTHEEGSRSLNTFIIQSCINKHQTHNDLSFVVQ